MDKEAGAVEVAALAGTAGGVTLSNIIKQLRARAIAKSRARKAMLTGAGLGLAGLGAGAGYMAATESGKRTKESSVLPFLRKPTMLQQVVKQLKDPKNIAIGAAAAGTLAGIHALRKADILTGEEEVDQYLKSHGMPGTEEVDDRLYGPEPTGEKSASTDAFTEGFLGELELYKDSGKVKQFLGATGRLAGGVAGLIGRGTRTAVTKAPEAVGRAAGTVSAIPAAVGRGVRKIRGQVASGFEKGRAAVLGGGQITQAQRGVSKSVFGKGLQATATPKSVPDRTIRGFRTKKSSVEMIKRALLAKGAMPPLSRYTSKLKGGQRYAPDDIQRFIDQGEALRKKLQVARKAEKVLPPSAKK